MKHFLRWPLAVSMMICASPALLALSPAEEAALPKTLRQEVLANRDAHAPRWLEKIVPGKQRLFYDEGRWREKADRIGALTGIGAEWRERLRATADRIVANPFPAYISPPPHHNAPEGWQRTYGDSLVALSVAASIWPEEKYTSCLREMMLAGCRFDSWGREGKQGELANMDLAAAHMARGVALAYDWHRGLFSEQDTAFIRSTMQQRMAAMLKGFYGGIFWANWYTQNHNHVCMASLGLAGAAFLGEIPEASEWLSAAELDFQRVGHAMYPDGSIFEGVPYWGYGRSFMLQYIEGTKAITGADFLYTLPMFRNSIAFRVGTALPGLMGTLLWGDSRGYDASGPQPVLYRLASQYHDGEGQYLANHLPFAPQGAADAMAWSLLWYDPQIEPVTPTQLDYHAPDWDVVTSRSGWGDGDYLISFKSGYNQNHHTKIDAGSLSLNFGGEWLLMAPGYGTDIYGKPGFFDKDGLRWTFFSNVTESHATLLINGRNQRSDIAARGKIDHYISSPSLLLAEENLSAAYEGIEDMRRRILHRRGDYLLVLDSVKADQPATVEWLAQVPPDAAVRSASLEVPGNAGNLTISRLGNNAAPFQARQPTVPNLDVEGWWMKTYSSRAEGSSVHLATLLQPIFHANPAAVLRAAVTNENGWQHIQIGAEAWQDDTWLAISGAPSPAPGAAGAEICAALFSLRQQNDAVTSIAAVQATKIATPFLTLEALSPFDAALETTTDGSILTLGTPFDGRAELPAGLSLITSKGVLIAAAKSLSLPNGRYYIVAKAGAWAALRQWAKSRFPGTPAPPSAPVAELPAQPVISRAVSLTWEAENFAAQTKGLAVASDRSEASAGKALLNFGSQSPTHTVTWNIEIPQAGAYRLSARYAVGQPRVGFAVLVDGKAPSENALKCSLRGLAGWGYEKYWTLNTFLWRNDVIRDAAGSDLLLPLTAGEHTLTFSGPSAAINIDTLTLSGTAD